MDKLVQEHVKNLLARMKVRDPKLHSEVQQKLGERTLPDHVAELRARRGPELTEGVAALEELAPTQAQRVAESIVRRVARPVLLIRDNRFEPEFSEDSEVWRDRL